MSFSFFAAAIQLEVKAHYATGVSPAAQLRENLQRHLAAIDQCVLEGQHRTFGLAPKLLVFPECSLHGIGPKRTRTFELMQKMALKIPGEETTALANKCRQHDVIVAGSAYEIDDAHPGKVFQTGFIIDTSGEIVLKYRKLNTTNNPFELATSPHDILDDYGNDPRKIFPVADTSLGKLGMMICVDAAYPEVARCLALNGAEVIIHPTATWRGAEQGERLTMMLRSRAMENTAAIVSCNWAHSPQSEYASSYGRSKIIRADGGVVDELPDAREATCFGSISLAEIRSARRFAGSNLLDAMRMECYAAAYASQTRWPANQLRTRNFETLDEKWAVFYQMTMEKPT